MNEVPPKKPRKTPKRTIKDNLLHLKKAEKDNLGQRKKIEGRGCRPRIKTTNPLSRLTIIQSGFIRVGGVHCPGNY
jgi:hypothetical protein